MDTIALLAGAVSMVIFAGGVLPMLIKAVRIQDLSQSVYVSQLPAGQVWWLHAVHVCCTALMLVWYLRYRYLPIRSRRSPMVGSAEAAASSRS